MQPVNWDPLPQRQMELLVLRGAGAGVGSGSGRVNRVLHPKSQLLSADLRKK